MTKSKDWTSGQALIEFAITSALAAAVCIAIGSGLWTEWTRLKCVHQLFEETHSRLVGRHPLRVVGRNLQVMIRISESEDRFTGEALCLGQFERIEFPKLNSATWRERL